MNCFELLFEEFLNLYVYFCSFFDDCFEFVMLRYMLRYDMMI